MGLPLFAQLAKRPAVVEGLLQIDAGGKCRLIQNFAVRTALHVLPHPALGIARRFGQDFLLRGQRKPTCPMQGRRGGDEPGFELPVRQHHRQALMRYVLLCPLVNFSAQAGRAVVIGIQHDQNPPIAATLGRCQKQLSAKFIVLVQKLVAPNPDGLQQVDQRSRFPFRSQSSQQDRQRGNLSVALHDRCDRDHDRASPKSSVWLALCCAMMSRSGAS
ncbi:hypothetical protein SAMN02787076_03970 [Rhizobacter sp. OV335]|nr:hypothetical protein SAMN02787076_03970 [Rhizobacter sp. OV335]